VTFIDSCGLGELSGAHQRAHREGRRLVVVRDRDTPLDRVLNVTHLDRWLEMTEDPTAIRA
jgi:anti-anti-sigma factor